MLDFTPVRVKQVTMAQLAEGLTRDDLRRLTNEMADRMLALIADCVDADVVYVPSDPKAHDEAAATAAELNMPWTLGHLIVHTTASAEESACRFGTVARRRRVRLVRLLRAPLGREDLDDRPGYERGDAKDRRDVDREQE